MCIHSREIVVGHSVEGIFLVHWVWGFPMSHALCPADPRCQLKWGDVSVEGRWPSFRQSMIT